MQKLICATIIMVVLLACSESEVAIKESCSGEINLECQQFPQTWKLVKMTGSMINSESTGENMSWQESILLKADGTFIKTREQSKQVIEATGAYSFDIAGDNETIELTLTYQSESVLIGSCYGLLVEKYLLATKCKLAGTWSHCDGPGLEYEKQ